AEPASRRDRPALPGREGRRVAADQLGRARSHHDRRLTRREEAPGDGQADGPARLGPSEPSSSGELEAWRSSISGRVGHRSETLSSVILPRRATTARIRSTASNTGWRRVRASSSPTCLPSRDRKSTRLNSSHVATSYAVFGL